MASGIDVDSIHGLALCTFQLLIRILDHEKVAALPCMGELSAVGSAIIK